ncbi:Di-copper centre-containing protein [Cucurbitaria berberidis CBS 394.84]|uniref:Di-copper centre-containing protein n=1 Tax=Cucurbitaria berberidis CBS 394.84 TaxID=1168544 RepID=A0A9P4LE25_9PLEO|nr:Di-copper centre-containing protein [Cucurbitaria berberidis CBS 394.84]KAF1851600.1 Di-copper centre-containing protein [Cucurbitaria berberidis CBS 394.84]
MAGNMVVNAVLASLCLFSGASAWPFTTRQTTLTLDKVQEQALANAYKVLDGTLSDGLTRPSTCNKNTVAVRKEFGDLSKDERKEYTRAVKCILEKPSKLSATKYPGAKSRYDDFVVVHMNMTPSVHATANFLHWHRYYIWAYETALRTECDYKGYQPYWNWAKYPDIVNSPIFNGDEWSMGGNGDAIGAHAGSFIGGQMVPGGPGGGCVTKGPFANLTIHLGPLMSTVDPKIGIKSNPRADGFGDNPRCLRRDVNNFFSSAYMRPQDLLDHITASAAIGKFQDSLQDAGARKTALHVGGHFSIWGDPGGDVYVSPAEPAFWLHHGQVDRHWWQWANYLDKEVKSRTSMYEGGTNWMNPNSARGKSSDLQWLDVVAPTGQNGMASTQFFSTTAGPLCYVYA